MFKIIIAGGRDFNNYGLLVKKCKNLLKNYDYDYVQIFCGMAKGADLLGKKFAENNNIDVREFPAKWKDVKGKPKNEIGRNSYGEYWKLAGYERNKLMGDKADALIAFWNGSSGTKQMIDYAKEIGLKIRVIKY